MKKNLQAHLNLLSIHQSVRRKKYPETAYCTARDHISEIVSVFDAWYVKLNKEVYLIYVQVQKTSYLTYCVLSEIYEYLYLFTHTHATHSLPDEFSSLTVVALRLETSCVDANNVVAYFRKSRLLLPSSQ